MKNRIKKIDFKDKKTVKKMIVIAVLIIAVLAGIIAISVNKMQIQSDLIYLVMPDSITPEESSDFPYTIYKQKNDNYDADQNPNEPLDALKFYYYNEKGEKIVIDGEDTIEYNGEDYGSPYIAFILNSVDTINNIKKAVSVVLVIIVILIIVGLIFLWYKRWSKKQDMEKEKKYGPKKIKGTKNMTQK